MDEERLPILGVIAGSGVAALGLILAGATGAPYFSTDSVNGWVVLFAAGLLGALFSTPFAFERRFRPRVDDPEKRWERALIAWGAVAITVGFAGFLLGVHGHWESSTSLAAAAGLLITIETAIVLGTMIVWLVSG